MQGILEKCPGHIEGCTVGVQSEGGDEWQECRSDRLGESCRPWSGAQQEFKVYREPVQARGQGQGEI